MPEDAEVLGLLALMEIQASRQRAVRVFDAGNIPEATSVTYTVEVTHP
jgi:predicted RNA polymerase sigma factor